MDENAKIKKQLSFVSFCLEEYKVLHGISGAEAAVRFKKYGVIDYLMEHYELLHSFGRSAILEDIELFIQKRRKKR